MLVRIVLSLAALCATLPPALAHAGHEPMAGPLVAGFGLGVAAATLVLYGLSVMPGQAHGERRLALTPLFGGLAAGIGLFVLGGFT